MIDVFWHPGVLEHDTGSGVFEAPPSPLMAVAEPHPENALRLHATLEGVLGGGPPLDDPLAYYPDDPAAAEAAVMALGAATRRA